MPSTAAVDGRKPPAAAPPLAAVDWRMPPAALRVVTSSSSAFSHGCSASSTLAGSPSPGPVDEYAFYRCWLADEAGRDPELAALAQLGGSSHCSSAVSSPRPQAGGASGGLSAAHHPQHAAGGLREQIARHLASSSQQQPSPPPLPALPPAAAVAAVVPPLKATAGQPQQQQPAVAAGGSSMRSPDGSSSSPPPRADFSHSQIKALRKLFPIKQPTLKPAAALQDYSLLDIIGRGAFGLAYKARHLPTGRLVCIKTLEAVKGETRAQADALKSQRREVAVLAALALHPSIIRYFECFAAAGGKLHIVMEYADGGDLASLIERHAKARTYMAEDSLLGYFAQLVAALAHVHSVGIMHRDIKSSNIFLTSAGILKLGDFGIAKVLDCGNGNSSSGSRPASSAGGGSSSGASDSLPFSRSLLAHSFVGTPGYLSPELVACEGYGLKADIWAAGCVLFEMAALKPAFRGKHLSAIYQLIKRGKTSALPSCYSPGLQALVGRMLSRDPNERPSTQELQEDELLRPHLARYHALLQQLKMDLPRPVDTLPHSSCSGAILTGQMLAQAGSASHRSRMSRTSSDSSRGGRSNEQLGRIHGHPGSSSRSKGTRESLDLVRPPPAASVVQQQQQQPAGTAGKLQQLPGWRAAAAAADYESLESAAAAVMVMTSLDGAEPVAGRGRSRNSTRSASDSGEGTSSSLSSRGVSSSGHQGDISSSQETSGSGSSRLPKPAPVRAGPTGRLPPLQQQPCVQVDAISFLATSSSSDSDSSGSSAGGCGKKGGVLRRLRRSLMQALWHRQRAAGCSHTLSRLAQASSPPKSKDSPGQGRKAAAAAAADEDEPRVQDRIPALHAGAAAAVEGGDEFYEQRSWAEVLREAGVCPQAAAADPELAQLLLQSGAEWEAASRRSSSARNSQEKASQRSTSSLDNSAVASGAGAPGSGSSSMERQLTTAKLQSAAARAAFKQWQQAGLEGQPQEAAPTTKPAIPVQATPGDDGLQQHLAALAGASRHHLLHANNSLLSTITECSESPSRVGSVASFAASTRGSVEVPGGGGVHARGAGSVERLSLSAARNSFSAQAPGRMPVRTSLSSLGNSSAATSPLASPPALAPADEATIDAATAAAEDVEPEADRAVRAEQRAALASIRRLKATLLQADGYTYEV